MLNNLKERKMRLAILSWVGVAIVALLVSALMSSVPRMKQQREQKALIEAQQQEEARLAEAAKKVEEAYNLANEINRLANEGDYQKALEICKKGIELLQEAAKIAGTQEYEQLVSRWENSLKEIEKAANEQLAANENLQEEPEEYDSSDEEVVEEEVVEE